MPHDGAVPKSRLALFAIAIIALSVFLSRLSAKDNEARRAPYTDLTANFLQFADSTAAMDEAPRVAEKLGEDYSLAQLAKMPPERAKVVLTDGLDQLVAKAGGCR